MTRKSKATKPTSKSPYWKPDLPLNRDGKAWLKRHRACSETKSAFRSAADRDNAGKSEAERRLCDNYSPATIALRDKWHAAIRELGDAADALAKRWEDIPRQGRLLPPADVSTLAIAAGHSGHAALVLSHVMHLAVVS